MARLAATRIRVGERRQLDEIDVLATLMDGTFTHRDGV